MALITCPKCGKQFSEHAKACPQCGISIEEALLLIQKREEESRLAAEREAAERERIRKEREAKEAEEARIRAEKRAEWWAANKKKVGIEILILIGIIVSIAAVKKISDVIAAKHAVTEAYEMIEQGKELVSTYHFDEAKDLYDQAYRMTMDKEVRNTIQEQNDELAKARQAAESEYNNALRRIQILLDADDNEFNEYSNECLDKMIKIYPNREETRYYRTLRGDEEADSNSIKEKRSNDAADGKTEMVDNFAWIYGTWHCDTPYGKMKVVLQKDGRMYDSVNEKWYNYKIEGGRIIEQCDGYISTYNIDEVNKRFDAGEPGVWYYKVSE